MVGSNKLGFFIICFCIPLVKDKVQIHKEIQKHTWRIHGQLFPPSYAKDPEQTEKYKETPGTFASHQHSNSSPLDIAAGEETEYRHEPKKPIAYRLLLESQCKKPSAKRPSTGDTPQLLQVLDPTSPSTTTVEGRPSRNPPPNSHTTRSLRCILEAKEGQQPPHQIGRETHRPQAPK